MEREHVWEIRCLIVCGCEKQNQVTVRHAATRSHTCEGVIIAGTINLTILSIISLIPLFSPSPLFRHCGMVDTASIIVHS